MEQWWFCLQRGFLLLLQLILTIYICYAARFHINSVVDVLTIAPRNTLVVNIPCIFISISLMGTWIFLDPM